MNKVIKFPNDSYQNNLHLYAMVISNLGSVLYSIKELNPNKKFDYLNRVELLKSLTSMDVETFRNNIKEVLDEIYHESLDELGYRTEINDLIDALTEHFKLGE